MTLLEFVALMWEARDFQMKVKIEKYDPKSVTPDITIMDVKGLEIDEDNKIIYVKGDNE